MHRRAPLQRAQESSSSYAGIPAPNSFPLKTPTPVSACRSIVALPTRSSRASCPTTIDASPTLLRKRKGLAFGSEKPRPHLLCSNTNARSATTTSCNGKTAVSDTFAPARFTFARAKERISEAVDGGIAIYHGDQKLSSPRGGIFIGPLRMMKTGDIEKRFADSNTTVLRLCPPPAACSGCYQESGPFWPKLPSPTMGHVRLK